MAKRKQTIQRLARKRKDAQRAKRDEKALKKTRSAPEAKEAAPVTTKRAKKSAAVTE